jgi:hypothetical protein
MPTSSASRSYEIAEEIRLRLTRGARSCSCKRGWGLGPWPRRKRQFGSLLGPTAVGTLVGTPQRVPASFQAVAAAVQTSPAQPETPCNPKPDKALHGFLPVVGRAEVRIPPPPDSSYLSTARGVRSESRPGHRTGLNTNYRSRRAGGFSICLNARFHPRHRRSICPRRPCNTRDRDRRRAQEKRRRSCPLRPIHADDG